MVIVNINWFSWQVDRLYLSSRKVIAVLDHEKKQTYVIRKEGLPDVGKLAYVNLLILV